MYCMQGANTYSKCPPLALSRTSTSAIGKLGAAEIKIVLKESILGYLLWQTVAGSNENL